MRHKTRTLAAALLGASLAVGGLAVAPTAALADIVDITTSTTYWSWVNDQHGTIDDAESYFSSDGYFGTTGDAFDRLGLLTITNSRTAQTADFAATSIMSTIDEGVRAEFVLTGTDPSGLNTIEATLMIEGNFARWSYAVSGPDIAEITLRFSGELGSDTSTVSTVSGTTAVSHDKGNSPDPVIGYSASTDGSAATWEFASDDEVSISTTGASLFAATVMLAHYNPCGFDEALAFTTERVANLDVVFGTAYPEFGTCFSAASSSYPAGVAVDSFVPLTAHPAIYTGAEEDYTDYALVPLFWVLGEEGGTIANSTSLSVSDLPPGLSGELLWDAVNGVRLHLTGTPTQSGNFTAQLAITIEPNYGEGMKVRIALPGAVAIVVTEPAAVIPATPDTPRLAESGFEAGGVAQGAVLVLLIGGLLAVGSRRLEAKRR